MPGLYAALFQARLIGRRRLGEIAARYAREKNIPVETVEQYLTGRLQTEFSHAQREGLEDFFDLAMRAGILDEPRPVKYFRP